MNLVFVRHGHSIWNLENRFTGWVDVELSDKGKEEAIKAGRTLKDINFIPEICMTSFLKRSKSTASLIIENLNGKDLLECVEIDKKPGLLQIIGSDGDPKRFQAHGKDCKIMKVITTDSKGEETTMHRLDIPEEEVL